MDNMAISRLASVLLVVILAGGCARAPQLIGVDNPEIPAASIDAITKHRMFLMSTRAASDALGVFYSSERAQELGLASVDATVPPTHVIGVLERPQKLPPDPRVEFTVVNPTVYGSESAFIAEIDRELSKRPPGERKILTFIHGFNNTTSDATLRFAQFVEDTGFSGVPVLFTWASAARGSEYVYDLNSALIARSQVGNMAAILSKTRAESVDIFAHSMGTFLTMEGLVKQQASGRLGKGAEIDHIVLASPDVDLNLFETQIAELPPSIVKKIYLLISKDDFALRFSRWIAGGVQRVGAADTAELENFGLTVIDLSKIEDSSSGSHSKFAGSPEVVQLIGAGMNSSRDFDEAGSRTAFEKLLDNTSIVVLRN